MNDEMGAPCQVPGSRCVVINILGRKRHVQKRPERFDKGKILNVKISHLD